MDRRAAAAHCGIHRVQLDAPLDMEPGAPYRVWLDGLSEKPDHRFSGYASKVSHLDVLRDREAALREDVHVTNEESARVICDQHHWVVDVDQR